MWPFRRKALPLGRLGENIAAKHLRRAGYRILERNARIGRYEIDIIAQNGDTIAFVEVKTRRDDSVVSPEDTVGPWKRQHIRRAARRYIADRDDPGMYYRFDVVSVLVREQGKPEVTVYEDAFRDEDERSWRY